MVINKISKRLSNKNRKGFTLIELIIVIAIVAILSAIGIPAIAGQVAATRISVLQSDAKVLATMLATSIKKLEAQGTPYRADPQTIAGNTLIQDCLEMSGLTYDESDITVVFGGVKADGTVLAANVFVGAVSIRVIGVELCDGNLRGRFGTV